MTPSIHLRSSNKKIMFVLVHVFLLICIYNSVCVCADSRRQWLPFAQRRVEKQLKSSQALPRNLCPTSKTPTLSTERSITSDAVEPSGVWITQASDSSINRTLETSKSSPLVPGKLNDSLIRHSTTGARVANQGDESSTPNNLIGGAITALMHNPRLLAKWSLTGLQVCIGLYLGQAIWQTAREVFQEFEDQASPTGGSVLKPKAIAHVLQEVQQMKPPTDHFSLHRIAKRLQEVTGWQVFNQDQTQPSIEHLLMSLSRNEYNILEQCLHVPTRNAYQLWNTIHGIPDIQQAVLDRLHSAQFCSEHNPYAPILENNHAGILLYGPPGCGKSMLLQAICSTVSMPCLILTPSILLKKYVGETNQLIRALFSLAQKLGHCVILLDELDGLFRERRHDEHDSSRELKTEFLQWWDGLAGANTNNHILFVGATNRPFDVDAAILRRMSQSHFIGLPMGPARVVILENLLKQLPTHENCINVSQLAHATEGFSPSDLVQLVRSATQQGPMRDSRSTGQFRPLHHSDLVQARQSMGPTPLSANYRNALIQFHQQQKQQTTGHAPMQQTENNTKKGGVVQSTPWGSFYHAGTVSVDDYANQVDDPSQSDSREEEDFTETSFDDSLDEIEQWDQEESDNNQNSDDEDL